MCPFGHYFTHLSFHICIMGQTYLHYSGWTSALIWPLKWLALQRMSCWQSVGTFSGHYQRDPKPEWESLTLSRVCRHVGGSHRMTQGGPGSENGPVDWEWRDPLNSSQVTLPWKKKARKKSRAETRDPEQGPVEEANGGGHGCWEPGLGSLPHQQLGRLLFRSSPL